MSDAGDVRGQEELRVIRRDDEDLVSPEILFTSLVMSALRQ